MHNISKQEIQDLAAQIVELCLHDDDQKILDKTRELYEMAVIWHFQNNEQAFTAINMQEKNVGDIIVVENKNIDPKNLVPNIDNAIVDITAALSEIDVLTENERKESEKSLTLELQFPEEDLMKEKPLEIKPDTADEIIKSPNPLTETRKAMPQISREEEMKESIPIDIAADLFERLDKTTYVKKSLNDKLSQEQIQIGLNDRIAFVKNLFEGNLADFNRVLSQLNSFETEQQAKDFLNKIVKTDYNWADKAEYENRLLQLIERKFL